MQPVVPDRGGRVGGRRQVVDADPGREVDRRRHPGEVGVGPLVDLGEPGERRRRDLATDVQRRFADLRPDPRPLQQRHRC